MMLYQVGQALASPICATTVGDLRRLLDEPKFSVQWEEITMDDGKPLLLSILEKDGSLWLEFNKTREGLWVQVAGDICRSGPDFETRFGPEQIHLGSSANWVLRFALAKGGKFKLTQLGTEKLRISGGGWSGTFLPSGK
jgi:hypothetical protein